MFCHSSFVKCIYTHRVTQVAKNDVFVCTYCELYYNYACIFVVDKYFVLHSTCAGVQECGEGCEVHTMPSLRDLDPNSRVWCSTTGMFMVVSNEAVVNRLPVSSNRHESCKEHLCIRTTIHLVKAPCTPTLKLL